MTTRRCACGDTDVAAGVSVGVVAGTAIGVGIGIGVVIVIVAGIAMLVGVVVVVACIAVAFDISIVLASNEEDVGVREVVCEFDVIYAIDTERDNASDSIIFAYATASIMPIVTTTRMRRERDDVVAADDVEAEEEEEEEGAEGRSRSASSQLDADDGATREYMLR